MTTHQQKGAHTIEDLYDLLKLALLPKSQNDDWSDLTKKHANMAMQRLRAVHGNKHISLCRNKIVIGEHNPITIQALNLK